MSTSPDVVDNTDRHRLEVDIDGEVAHLDYTLQDHRLTIAHTIVPDTLGGRGLGGVLVQAALDKATAENLAVHVECQFAKSWLDKHPDAAASVEVS
jgi:predicted GNAT family acetyltransferase